MNFIGLDISKVSTAMAIETSGKEYLFSYNNQKESNKWCKSLSEAGVNIKFYEYDNDIDEYSLSEINKLQTFIKISNDIIKDILAIINKDEETIIFNEGYSYGQNVGPLIDLVGIGALVRAKVYENIPNIKEMRIISPKSLKTITAEMVYGSDMVTSGVRVIKTEKVIRTNKEGIKGGDFDKIHMFQAIVDLNKEFKLSNYIKEYYDEIKALKSFPKPLEDINDAWLLKEIIKFQINPKY